ncbi:hypothetical protein AB205_0194280 [Aquarana catesbeiana]|uniref:Uncharacterized protein n=1 Tax=Aquarana catesbeiana TaxID=8400 RepID=A0A2G9Q8N8_AQUCT|nr:hypothetical protein AB205_0194280 [Aquarana catesbeiana]
MCETCPKKGKYCSFVKRINVFHLELCPKQTILPHFQTMFHIHISGHKYLCAKYTFCFIPLGEKRLGTLENNRNPLPPEEGEQRTQPQDVEEGEVVEIITTTGDVHVVEEQSTHFKTDSAQRLIQEIMFCSRDLDLIKEKKQGD